MNWSDIQPFVSSVVRHGIGALGAALATHGVSLTGSDMDQLSGAVMVLLAVGWSFWHKTTVVQKPLGRP